MTNCSEFKFIGVLRHMQRYFSPIYVTAQMCRRIEEVVPTVGLPTPDISQGSLTCPSYTDTGLRFLYGDPVTSPHLVAFNDTRGIRRTYSRLKTPTSSRGWPTARPDTDSNDDVAVFESTDLIFYFSTFLGSLMTYLGFD